MRIVRVAAQAIGNIALAAVLYAVATGVYIGVKMYQLQKHLPPEPPGTQRGWDILTFAPWKHERLLYWVIFAVLIAAVLAYEVHRLSNKSAAPPCEPC
ncbi:MAG: hypothetical protein WA875_08345 [Candidatus Acidiferrales bacterium]